MENQITKREPAQEFQTALQIRAQVNLIQEVMKAVMIGPSKDYPEGVHYGVVPGCKKPTLLKPGSEKLLSTFRIAVEPEIVDLSTADEIRYQVRARGVHIPTGRVVGIGIGECSSNEEKYKWRRAVCKEEFDETPADRRRGKWGSEYRTGKTYQTWQVRTNPADVANTVLKMAKKRAQIDLTLTATGASDIFTQDIEDVPDEIRENLVDGEEAPKTVQQPQRIADKTGVAKEQVITEIHQFTNKKDPNALPFYEIKTKQGNVFHTGNILFVEEAKAYKNKVSDIEFKINDGKKQITAILEVIEG